MNTIWYLLAFLGGLLFIQPTNAQYLSVKGDFSVDQQLGCHDLQVTVTNINPGTGTIIYQFQGSGSATTTNPVHTYSAPGTYWINQFIQGATGDKKDSVSVTVVIPEPPDIELLSCNNFELLVLINDSYYDVYEINYGDGTIIQAIKNSAVPPHTYADNAQRTVSVTGLFTTATNRCGVIANSFTPTTTVQPAQIDSLIALNNSTLKLNYSLPAHSVNKLEVAINNSSTYQLFKNLNQNTIVDTLTSLNLSQSIYCFRIATFDACSNFKAYSNQICSIDISATAQNNQLTIDWNSIDFGPGQITGLYRDGTLHQSIASPVFQHIDSTVVCNTIYCYLAQINFTGGGISRSLQVCETAFSSDVPPTIDNISSITNNDSILWTWQIPVNTTPTHYIAYQVNEQGVILRSDSVPSNSFTGSYDNAIKYMAIELHDICKNKSPIGNVGNNIQLQGKVNQSFDIELTWNNYFGWIDGFQDYYITVKNTQGELLDSIATGGIPEYTLELSSQTDQTMIFTVWAVPVLAEIERSRSNVLAFERDPIISIPNSFTPNGDGLNDQFIVTGKFISSYEMQIFNRWGEVLFQTTDLEMGWDGTSNNKKMQVGNYAYWMRIKDLNDNEHIRTGSILILSN